MDGHQTAQREQGWRTLLQWLFREGPLTMEELKGRTELGRSALYQRLRECQEKEWVQAAIKLVAGRRVNSYSITLKGAALLKPLPWGGDLLIVTGVTAPPEESPYANVKVEMNPGKLGRFHRVSQRRVKGGGIVTVEAEGATVGRNG